MMVEDLSGVKCMRCGSSFYKDDDGRYICLECDKDEY
jgi:DNA-directed RNA polymerase subunit RPC12/RpoP